MDPAPCPLLCELADELVELWHSAEQGRRRRLWADHFNGRTKEVPVSCAMFQGSQDLVWQQILPEDSLVHKTGLARGLELHLRHRLWRAANIPDDTPVDPTLVLHALPPLAPDELWGVPLGFQSTGAAGGAYKPKPPLEKPEDIDRLRRPRFRHDPEAVERLQTEVHGLIGDRLSIVFRCDALHNGPFEWAVRLRGMDALLLDCYDRPDWLKQLMDFLSRSIVRYHQEREAAGFANARFESALHSPWDDEYETQDERLSSCWVYLHAQSAASYGPATYAEFVHPYNVPIARLFGKIYYHGCEDLTAKVRVIRDLPGLRQFHVSPWSQVAPIASKLPAGVVMEVHSHPANVLLLWDEAQMREELEELARAAGDHLFNLKLCDIQTINADGGEALIAWSRMAREVAARCRA